MTTKHNKSDHFGKQDCFRFARYEKHNLENPDHPVGQNLLDPLSQSSIEASSSSVRALSLGLSFSFSQESPKEAAEGFYLEKDKSDYLDIPSHSAQSKSRPCFLNEGCKLKSSVHTTYKYLNQEDTNSVGHDEIQKPSIFGELEEIKKDGQGPVFRMKDKESVRHNSSNNICSSVTLDQSTAIESNYKEIPDRKINDNKFSQNNLNTAKTNDFHKLYLPRICTKIKNLITNNNLKDIFQESDFQSLELLKINSLKSFKRRKSKEKNKSKNQTHNKETREYCLKHFSSAIVLKHAILDLNSLRSIESEHIDSAVASRFECKNKQDLLKKNDERRDLIITYKKILEMYKRGRSDQWLNIFEEAIARIEVNKNTFVFSNNYFNQNLEDYYNRIRQHYQMIEEEKWEHDVRLYQSSIQEDTSLNKDGKHFTAPHLPPLTEDYSYGRFKESIDSWRNALYDLNILGNATRLQNLLCIDMNIFSVSPDKEFNEPPNPLNSRAVTNQIDSIWEHHLDDKEGYSDQYSPKNSQHSQVGRYKITSSQPQSHNVDRYFDRTDPKGSYLEGDLIENFGVYSDSSYTDFDCFQEPTKRFKSNEQ